MRRLNWYILNYFNSILLCTNIMTSTIVSKVFPVTLTTEKDKK